MQDDFSDGVELGAELASVQRFLTLVAHTPFYRALGQPLDPFTSREAQAFADAMGFPDTYPAALEDWVDAAAAAESLDVNNPAWDEEHRLRGVLAQEAELLNDPRTLEVALTRVAQAAQEALVPAIEESAALLGIVDEGFQQAALGAGVQACHQAALVLAAGHGADHPFSLKFSLFEAGRWPIAIVGSSFNIF